jgi:hypothetical protein
MKTKSYAARSAALPLVSFSLQRRNPLPDDFPIEVRY